MCREMTRPSVSLEPWVTSNDDGQRKSMQEEPRTGLSTLVFWFVLAVLIGGFAVMG